MGRELCQHRPIERAGIGRLPVERHPFADQRAVERSLAAEHEVDPRRLVQKVRALQVAAHLRLQAPDHPRQQRVVQRVPVDRLRARVQFWSLRQPKPDAAGDRLARQCPCGIQHRQQRWQVGVGDRVERHGGRNFLVAVECGRHIRHLALTRGSRPQHRADRDQRQEGHAAERRHPDQHPLPGRTRPFAHKHRFAEHQTQQAARK